jgi:type IV secretory pathway VirB6-like protein
MFEKTKGIFEGWWKQLLGFTLQPMILFVYIGIMVTLFDKMVIGDDVTFSPSTVNISGVNVVDTYGRIAPKRINCTGTANDTSIYCIFRVADIHTYTGFEVLGIGIPILTSMNEAKLQTIIKVGLIMFIFTKFMDKISEFAASLVGGKEISSSGVGMAAMAKKAQSALRGIQQRGMGLIRKHGAGMAKRAGGIAKSTANKLGNRGKSVESKEAVGGQSSVGGGQGANAVGGGAPRSGVVGGAGGSSAVKPPAASPPKKP